MIEQIIDIVQRIGVFMILGETIIHFCPGQNYDKYIRLLMEMMLITMLMIPFITLVKSDVMHSFQTELKDFEVAIYGNEQELKQEQASVERLENALMEETQKEILAHISEWIKEFGYQARRVEFSGEEIVVYVKKINTRGAEIYIDPMEQIQIGVDDKELSSMKKIIAEKFYVNQEQVTVKG